MIQIHFEIKFGSVQSSFASHSSYTMDHPINPHCIMISSLYLSQDYDCISPGPVKYGTVRYGTVTILYQNMVPYGTLLFFVF